ncbi:MAG: TauD/TfdA family dioxygenase [Gammaproteobacteria bacterium]|nr:TauD/TfdA family dioxygenase [Gammaproteobacteria bacterium]
MAFQHIRLQPISGSLGTIVHGVDLRQPLDDATYQEVKQALLDNLVLFFRDQDLTPGQQVEFGRQFGDLHIHPFIPSLADHKEIIVLKAKNGAEENLRLANAWHPDLSYTSDPPLLGILRAVRPPSRGGDTMWVNLYRAYETLSPKMQAIVGELSAWHDVTKTYRRQELHTPGGPERYAQTLKKAPPVLHPLVAVHPETGRKLLYLSELTTTHIEGLREKESNALLQMLFQHIDWKELHCRFYWEKNSIAVWDNRCTVHYAVGDYDEPREMHRVTVIGDRLK